MSDIGSHVPSSRATVPLTVADAWRGACLCLALPTVAVAYSFNLASFLHAKEMVLCVWLVAMSLLVLAAYRHTWDGLLAFLPLWALLAPVLLYAFTAPVRVPSDAVIEAARWVLILLLPALSYDLFCDGLWRKRIERSIVVSTIAVAILGLLQYARLCPGLFPEFEGYTQRVYSVFGNQDLFGGYVALGIPLLAYRFLSPSPAQKEDGGKTAYTGRAALFLLLLILVCALLVSGSRSAWLAALAGLVVALGHSRVSPRRIILMGMLLGAFVLATAIVVPEATVQRLKQTFSHVDEGRNARWWLWRAGLSMFHDEPLMGVGLGQYAYWSPRYIGDCLTHAGKAPGFDIERHADHPHSELVKVLAETGIVGLICWGWMLLRIPRRRSPWDGSLVVFAVFALFNGPFQSVAHAGAAVVLATLLMADGKSVVRTSWWPGPMFAILTVLTAAFSIWAVFLPGYMRQQADDAYLAGRPALGAYERLTRHPWPHALARKNYAIALAGSGYENEAYDELLYALDGLDTGDVYLDLAILAFQRGDTVETQRWTMACLRRWPENGMALDLLERITEPTETKR